jgi:hypothetical protein
MADRGYVHFADSGEAAVYRLDEAEIQSMDEGWDNLCSNSERDYQVYDGGRLVTPTKWALRQAWLKILNSTNPNWYCENHIFNHGDKWFISRDIDLFEEFPEIFEKAEVKESTSVGMYASGHSTGVSMEGPFCFELNYVVVQGEVCMHIYMFRMIHKARKSLTCVNTCRVPCLWPSGNPQRFLQTYASKRGTILALRIGNNTWMKLLSQPRS